MARTTRSLLQEPEVDRRCSWCSEGRNVWASAVGCSIGLWLMLFPGFSFHHATLEQGRIDPYSTG